MRPVKETGAADEAPPGAEEADSHAPPLEADASETVERAAKPAKRRRWPRFSLWWALGGALAVGLALLLANWTSIRSGTLERAAAVQRAVVEHPEFAIRRVAINGHRRTETAEILAAIGLDRGAGQVSSLRFDAAAARGNLLELPWIAAAEVTLDPAGLLRVELAEKRAAAIWHAEDGHWLIDGEGARIIAASGPETRPDLPMLIGFDADKAVDDARRLLNSLPRALLSEVAALVRRGGRRWDAVLTSGLVLKLPADDPLAALRRYSDQQLGPRVAEDAVTAIDLRFPDEPPALRLEPGAAEMRLEMLEGLRKSN